MMLPHNALLVLHSGLIKLEPHDERYYNSRLKAEKTVNYLELDVYVVN